MYGILRANKIKLSCMTKRFQTHIQRQSNYYHSNPDIDVSKQNEDVVLVFSEDFKKSIFSELEKHNITKEPRKNAVGLIDGVITASPAFFDKKKKDSIVDFFKNALPIIESEYGPIISAAIHFDERTPHLHFCTVPILKNSQGNYKLSAKEIMGNRQEYIAKQDRFFEQYFMKYGLQRGQSVKKTSRKHIDHNRYKAEKAREEFMKTIEKTNEQKGINQDLIIQQAELQRQIKEEEERQKDLLSELSNAHEIFEETLSHINNQKRDKKRIEEEIKTLEDVFQQLQVELLEMANSSEMYKELLKRSLLEGNYNDAEEFKRKVMEAEEATEIWEYMQEFYSKSFERIEDDNLVQ